MRIDRRVQRTRGALYDALAALVVEKRYDDISIQDILDSANVGRSTFYAHFDSKDDLLRRGLDRLRALLTVGHRESGGKNWSYSLVAFQHVSDYRLVYYRLVGTPAGAVVLTALREAIADFVRRHAPLDPSTPRELAAQFVASTFMTVTVWWLDHAPHLEPAEADCFFTRLAQSGAGKTATL